MSKETLIFKENSQFCLAFIIDNATDIPPLFHHSFYIPNKYYYLLFRTSVLYSTFVQNIFYRSANSFPLTPVLPSLQLSFQHSFFNHPLTLHSSLYLRFRLYCILPLFHSFFFFYIPPCHSPDFQKNYLNFLFSSRKFNLFYRV